MTVQSCSQVVEALLLDAERYGGTLTIEHVERVLDRRKVSPDVCVEVFRRLISQGIISRPADDPELLEGETPLAPPSPSDITNSGDVSAPSESQSTSASARDYQNSLRDLGDHPLLSAREEKELGRAIAIANSVREAIECGTMAGSGQAEAILRRGDEARTKLTLMNLRLVMKSAYRWSAAASMDFEDLFQEGVIGLMRAVDKFDHTLGFRFSTYATWWIEQAITRCLADTGQAIRLPVHVHEDLIKLRRAVRVFFRFHERLPTVQELAGEIEMPPGKVQFLLDISNRKMVDLDKPLSDDPKTTLADILPSPGPTPEESAAEVDAREVILDILSSLTPREKVIIMKRFGLDYDGAMTLQELGDHFNVTRERIRQIEAKALRKLRHPTRQEKLAGLLHSD